MREKDTLAKLLYDTILGEVQLRESRGETLNDDAIIKIVLKMKESCQMMVDNGDTTASNEVKLCEALLPAMMSKDDIIALLQSDMVLMTKISKSDNRMRLMKDVKSLLDDCGKKYNGRDASDALKEI